MKATRCLLLYLFILLNPTRVISQETDTLFKKSDKIELKADSSARQKNDIRNDACYEHAKITGKVYFNLLFSDFKQQITKPFHMSGNDWANLGKFAIVFGALSLADEQVQQRAVRFRENKGLRNVSSFVTQFGGSYEVYLLLGLGSCGYIFNNEKLKTTTLLASQSYITSGVISALIKTIAGKQRPIYIDPNTNEAEPVFHSFFHVAKDMNGKKINVSSFPSGHTTAAFSVATVFAMEYKDKPWVPIIAYSGATLIGLSRITENKHWISDVFAGAALGYLSGRQVVNNYHRYSKLKNAGQRKNTLSFNLQYGNRTILPGFVYTFR